MSDKKDPPKDPYDDETEEERAERNRRRLDILEQMGRLGITKVDPHSGFNQVGPNIPSPYDTRYFPSKRAYWPTKF